VLRLSEIGQPSVRSRNLRPKAKHSILARQTKSQNAEVGTASFPTRNPGSRLTKLGRQGWPKGLGQRANQTLTRKLTGQSNAKGNRAQRTAKMALEELVGLMNISRSHFNCEEYPHCICASLHSIYADLLEQWCDPSLPPPSLAEIKRAAPVIHLMLTCLFKGCPDFGMKTERWFSSAIGLGFSLACPGFQPTAAANQPSLSQRELRDMNSLPVPVRLPFHQAAQGWKGLSSLGFLPPFNRVQSQAMSPSLLHPFSIGEGDALGAQGHGLRLAACPCAFPPNNGVEDDRLCNEPPRSWQGNNHSE
jgi:hypothetical protein